MTNINNDIHHQQIPELDLTLVSNINAAELSTTNTFAFYDLNLSQEDKELLSSLTFKCNEKENFSYEESMPTELFSYNLKDFFNYKLLNNSYSEKLTNIIEKIYTASIYNKKPGEIISFDLHTACDGTVYEGGSWHIDANVSTGSVIKDSSFIYRNLITLSGPATSIYGDATVRDYMSTHYLHNTIQNNGINNDLIDYSKVMQAPLGQGVIADVQSTLHAVPYGDAGNRLILLIDKRDTSSDDYQPYEDALHSGYWQNYLGSVEPAECNEQI